MLQPLVGKNILRRKPNMAASEQKKKAGQSQPNWMQNPPQAKPPPMATCQGVKLRGVALMSFRACSYCSSE
ncbi:Uncharacterised protein [Segatella copri]|nr:Uncharacterised protein [Segatella copri]